MKNSPESPGFRALERALLVRRWRAVDARLRVELAVLALLLGAFVFWRTRVPLDGLAKLQGALAAVGAALVLIVVCAAVAGVAVAVRLRGALLRGPAGPEWLSLPCERSVLERHFGWNAALIAPLAVLPAAAVLVALVHLVSWVWIAALSVMLGALLAVATHVGCRAGRHLASGAAVLVSAHAASRGAPAVPLEQARRPRLAAPLWRRSAPAIALMFQDATLSLRPSPARMRALSFLAITALAGAAWIAPWPARLAHAAAFALGLAAAGIGAEWTIDVTGLHPSAILRALPLGVGALWGSRMAWAGLAAAVLVGLQALAARGASPVALRVHLVWLGAAALAIGALGAHLAITLHPRTDHAHRVLALSLGLALVASLMIPLLGWVLLLTAVLHSARRLPGWTMSGGA